MGRFPSGQRGQTVNLLSYDFDGSNPSLPSSHAEVAQLVEQHLDMVEVVGSSPIPRILFKSLQRDVGKDVFFARVVRIVLQYAAEWGKVRVL